MSAFWWIAPAATGFFGLLLILGAFTAIFRGRVFKALRGVSGGAFLIMLAALISMFALNIQSYGRLTWERPIATVSVAEIAPRSYDVTVAESGRPAHIYQVEGDQWQLDARVITWKPWANILGLNAQYELQRLWGRHIRGERRNTAAAVDLQQERPGIDVLFLSSQMGKYAFLQEREFGSAVYMPLADGAVYEVKISQKALVVDPKNTIAEQAVNGGGLEAEPPPGDEPEPERPSRGLRITLPKFN